MSSLFQPFAEAIRAGHLLTHPSTPMPANLKIEEQVSTTLAARLTESEASSMLFHLLGGIGASALNDDELSKAIARAREWALRSK